MATLSVGLVTVEPSDTTLALGVVEVVAAAEAALSVGLVEIDTTVAVIPDNGMALKAVGAWHRAELWIDVPD